MSESGVRCRRYCRDGVTQRPGSGFGRSQQLQSELRLGAAHTQPVAARQSDPLCVSAGTGLTTAHTFSWRFRLELGLHFGRGCFVLHRLYPSRRALLLAVAARYSDEKRQSV
jgi:hypothetical protein